MTQRNLYHILQRAGIILLALAFFLISVDMLSNSFKFLGEGLAQSLIEATSNPFISLFVGLLITAIIQSSSTSTAMIVAFVASGGIDYHDAVPMVLGANIGTTITSTLVAIGFIAKKKEFRKAISGGVVHDFFNIVAVSIFFPLEYYYQLISKGATYMAHIFHLQENVNGDVGFSPIFNSVEFINFILSHFNFPIVLVIFSFLLLLISIKLLAKYIYEIISGGSADNFKRFFFGKRIYSFLWGILLTAGVLSSSVTTSLIVPFVATGKVKLNKAFHFIMGANIGTTLTAIFAAFFKSEAALAIAFAHLLFNFAAAFLFLLLPFLRKAIINLAIQFGMLTMRRRIVGFAYLAITFFLLPFSLIYMSEQHEAKEKVNKKPEIEIYDASEAKSDSID